MKPLFSLGLIFMGLLLLRNTCGFGGPCDEKLLKRLPSPDGKLVLGTYHRECSHMVYTAATVEKPMGFWDSKPEVICYLVSWMGRHPINAEWKSANRIFISTTDRLEIIDAGQSKDSCERIKVEYSIQFRNEEQETNDPEAISKMRKILAEVGSCIERVYKGANPGNDPVGEINALIDRREHRSAAERLFGFTADAHCPISPATYQSFKELSETFDLKPGYLEDLTPLVTR